jgi:hypothetical protein
MLYFFRFTTAHLERKNMTSFSLFKGHVNEGTECTLDILLLAFVFSSYSLCVYLSLWVLYKRRYFLYNKQSDLTKEIRSS